MRNPRREALLALRALLTCFHSGVRGRIRRRIKTQVVVARRFRAAGNGGLIAKLGPGLIGSTMITVTNPFKGRQYHGG